MRGQIRYSAPATEFDPIDFKSFSSKMRERDDDHFDIDDEFLGSADEASDFEPIVERSERRPKASVPVKRGKAAWSRVEDVMAERALERELRDVFEDD
ncbi:MAG: hypothetical protein JSR95_08880 [Proteobacteria bacterium]|jgi:hypothetical protein|nr:hypothetical protein [Pseudomonadota bacterium]